MFLESHLRAADLSMCFRFFSSHSSADPARKVWLSSFYSWRNWVSEKLTHSPKVTRLAALEPDCSSCLALFCPCLCSDLSREPGAPRLSGGPRVQQSHMCRWRWLETPPVLVPREAASGPCSSLLCSQPAVLLDPRVHLFKWGLPLPARFLSFLLSLLSATWGLCSVPDALGGLVCHSRRKRTLSSVCSCHQEVDSLRLALGCRVAGSTPRCLFPLRKADLGFPAPYLPNVCYCIWKENLDWWFSKMGSLEQYLKKETHFSAFSTIFYFIFQLTQLLTLESQDWGAFASMRC